MLESVTPVELLWLATSSTKGIFSGIRYGELSRGASSQFGPVALTAGNIYRVVIGPRFPGNSAEESSETFIP